MTFGNFFRNRASISALTFLCPSPVQRLSCVVKGLLLRVWSGENTYINGAAVNPKAVNSCFALLSVNHHIGERRRPPAAGSSLLSPPAMP